MHILVRNQNFEKQKKLEFQNFQTKVPPQLWTKYAEKSGYGD
jgi:hypothetical protein